MSDSVPGYVLREIVGEGASATVWRAEVEGHPGRIVAVKRLRGPVRAPDLDTLRREATALERLSHPSILRLLEVVDDGPGAALVVPFAPGGCLASRIAAGDPALSPAFVADLGARLASALAAAHNAGLVHRDVKPTNILFDAEGQPLLADFGTARLLDDERPVTAGTAEYLDPAALSGDPGAASDIYGLGATLYEAVAGTPPYAGSTPGATLRAAARGRHLTVGQLIAMPEELASTIEQAIARDPEDRPATAAVLAAHLDEARRVLETGDVAADEATEGGPPTPLLARPDDPAPSAPPRAPGGGEPLHAGPATDSPRPPTPPPASGPTSTAPPTPATVAAAPARPAHPGSPERSITRSFGPPPPRPAPEAPRVRRRVDRRLLLVAAALVVATPLGVVWWLASGADSHAPAAESGSTTEAATSTPGTDAGPGGTDDSSRAAEAVPGRDDVGRTTLAEVGEDHSERVPPARCDDVEPITVEGAQRLDADVDGRGCSVGLLWDGEFLVVPRAGEEPARYELDAQDRDELLLGDWNCDGRDTPALYRPATGELFRFDGFAEHDQEISGHVERTRVRGAAPRVVTDTDGCDLVDLEPA